MSRYTGMTQMVTTPQRHISAPPQTPLAATPASVKLPFYSSDEVDQSIEFSPPRYAFTPRPINSKVPKAWERRPATPFKPRGNGKQKIWKRVAADENEIDNSLHLRTKKEDTDAKRAVKKMKISDAVLPGIVNAFATSFDDEEQERTHKARNENQDSKAGPERHSSGVDDTDSSLPRSSEQALRQENQSFNASKKRETIMHPPSTSNTAFDYTSKDLISEGGSDKNQARNADSTAQPAVEPERDSLNAESNDQGGLLQMAAEEVESAPSSISDEAADYNDLQNVTGTALIANSDGTENLWKVDRTAKNTEPISSSHHSLEETNIGLESEVCTSLTDSDSTETIGSPPEDLVSGGPERASLAEAATRPEDGVEMANLPSSLTQSFIECTPDDDTEFLQGFLSRAKAKKAAKAATQKNENLDSTDVPPARNTRSRSAVPSSKRETRSSKNATEVVHLSRDISIEEQDTSEHPRPSPRRSTRTRLPKPQAKATPTIPSTIPVRRSNGTEFVFLPRDETQKVAIATRQNTARNKGEAVHPVFRLQSLNSDERPRSRSRSRSPRKRTKTDKQVQWDADLAKYYEEKEKEKKRKDGGGARKVRRLGTPAPKRKKNVLEGSGLEE